MRTPAAAMNPNYFSKSAELNKLAVCSCGNRVYKTELRMKNGREVCPTCYRGSK